MIIGWADDERGSWANKMVNWGAFDQVLQLVLVSSHNFVCVCVCVCV